MNSRGLPSTRGQIFGEDLSGSDCFVAPAASEVALGDDFRREPRGTLSSCIRQYRQNV